MKALLCVTVAVAWLIATSALPRGAGAAECTGSWTADEVPSIDASTSFLSDVAAISPTDVWAVGGGGEFTSGGQITGARPIFVHWDGDSWKTVDFQHPERATLVAIAGSGPNDVWAVGAGGQVLNQLIVHWDGTAWTQVPTPDVVNSRLTSVASVSANDAWVVGDAIDRSSGYHKLIAEHWDGASWSVAEMPDIGALNGDLQAIAVASPTDIWVGGTQTDPLQTDALRQRIYLHWDGTAWSKVDAPDVGTPSFSLRGMTATSANDVWAVGDPLTDDGGPFIEHWDGSAWTIVSGPTEHLSLSGIDMVSASDGWAVGGDTSGKALITRWDGSSWTTVPNSLADKGLLVAMSSLSSGESWAVGYEDTGQATSKMAIQHICFSGRTLNPSEAAVPTQAPATDTGGSGTTLVIIAGAVVAGVAVAGGGAFLLMRKR